MPSRTYTPPEPSTLRALAFAHIVIAGVCLLSQMLQTSVDSSRVDRQVQHALKGVENEQVRAMANTLRRTIDIKDGLRDHLARKLPISQWHGQANQVVDLCTSLLLLAAGVALLKRRPIAWQLSLGYAGVSLLQKVFNVAYLGLLEVPAARAYLETLQRLHPQESGLIQAVLDPIASGPLYQLLFAVYPILVGVVMLQPQIRQRLQTPETSPAPPPSPAAQLPLPSAAFPDDGGFNEPARVPSERW
jgi:hypothetical protein